MNDFPSVMVNLHVTSTISLKRSALLSEQRSHFARLPLFSFLGGHSSSALWPALYVSVVSKYSCYKYHRRGWIPGEIMSWWQRHRCNRGCEIPFHFHTIPFYMNDGIYSHFSGGKGYVVFYHYFCITHRFLYRIFWSIWGNRYVQCMRSRSFVFTRHSLMKSLNCFLLVCHYQWPFPTFL